MPSDFARVLFWLIVPIALFGNYRWALLALIALTHLDTTPMDSYSSSASVGLENLIKTLVIPGVLLMRIRFEPLMHPWSRAARLWLVFTCIAAVGFLWSPYHIPAVKMVSYLIAHGMLFAVFWHAWRTRLLVVQDVLFALMISFALAIVQTYGFANQFGLVDYGFRVTSFSAPQYFAAFLSCCLAVVLCSDLSTGTKVVAATVTEIFIVATGSRYVTVGSFVLLFLVWFVAALRSPQRIRKLLQGCALIFALSCVPALLAYFDSENRINELFDSFGSGGTVEDVGTFGWRLAIYSNAYTALDERVFSKSASLLFGSGTSTGGELLSAADAEVFDLFEDSNRAVHNEFLRCAYEWGLVGLAVFLSFLWTLGARVYDLFFRQHRQRALAALIFLPTLLIGLTIENLLAGSSTPFGVGLAMMMGFAFSSAPAESIPDGKST
jgi:hypothetical protein